MKPGTLVLLPNLLGDEADPNLLPAALNEIAQRLNGFFVESERGGRRACRRMLGPNFRHPYLPIHQESLTPARCKELLEPLLKGECWGLLSDAGMPCIADPGSLLVQRAHQLGLPVTAIPGPSSILLACMLSGFPCQRFAFHGYLPRERDERQKLLRQLEKRSLDEQATQCWIETPYRTHQMINELITVLQPSTLLSVASDLTLPTEQVISRSIRDWSPVAEQTAAAVFSIFSSQPTDRRK
jgi:16S rRNA (cytidine1402-2'-O)-methyltransferase